MCAFRKNGAAVLMFFTEGLIWEDLNYHFIFNEKKFNRSIFYCVQQKSQKYQINDNIILLRFVCGKLKINSYLNILNLLVLFC